MRSRDLPAEHRPVILRRRVTRALCVRKRLDHADAVQLAGRHELDSAESLVVLLEMEAKLELLTDFCVSEADPPPAGAV